MSFDEVMRRYCDGDEAAFAELYSALAPRIFGYLRSLIRDDAAAEDLLQQTFLKLHGARGTYVVGADPVPWLYAIAHRTCLDELRRLRRAKVRPLGPDEELEEIAAGFSGTAVGAEAYEPYDDGQRAAVLRALTRLPEEQKRAVVLTKLEGRSMREAAVILGTTEGAVKLRAHRAYVRLRVILRCDEAFADASDGTAFAPA